MTTDGCSSGEDVWVMGWTTQDTAPSAESKLKNVEPVFLPGSGCTSTSRADNRSRAGCSTPSHENLLSSHCCKHLSLVCASAYTNGVSILLLDRRYKNC